MFAWPHVVYVDVCVCVLLSLFSCFVACVAIRVLCCCFGHLSVHRCISNSLPVSAHGCLKCSLLTSFIDYMQAWMEPWIGACIRVYIHNIHSIRTYIQAYIHTYLHTCIPTDIQADRQTGRQTCVYVLVCACVWNRPCMCARLYICGRVGGFTSLQENMHAHMLLIYWLSDRFKRLACVAPAA